MVYLVQNGRTPLMAASSEGHADIVQTLIEAKAQINTQDEVYAVPTTRKHTSHTDYITTHSVTVYSCTR